MLEVDAGLQPFEVSDLGGEALLDLISDNRDAEWRAARHKLRLAHQLCVTNPAGPGIDPATWGDGLPGLASDFDQALGGDGTPLVAAFVTEDWAAATGVSRRAAKQWLANTLDLHHRLPRAHRRVERLELEVWRACRLAEDTHDLSRVCARWIDRLLDEEDSYSWKAIDRAVKLGAARFHPEKLADEGPLPGREDWDVCVDHDDGAEGTSTLKAIGDSLDLAKFHDLLTDEAVTLGRLGDTDSLGQRKAKALGVIADRQATLDLLGGHATPTDPVHPDTGAPVPRRRSYLKARLFVHLSLADLVTLCSPTGPGAADGSDGVVDTNLFGPETTRVLREQLDRLGSDAQVTPVIDTARTWALDRHDPPEGMRSQVILRDRHCVHPYCGVASAHCDLDHVVPYDEDGPPGQTSPENLAPLCRRHHLLKTHGGWRYRRNDDGTYTWTNQHGRAWLVAPFGTTELTS